MTSPVISVRNLSKSYRLYSQSSDRLKEVISPWRKRHTLFYAIQDISFDVQPNEHLGIIGVNGAGKSTLLQILAGVLTPTTGDVEIRGRVSALLELGAGFNPELSGRENVKFLTSTLNSGEEIGENDISKIIDFADIGKFIDQPVKTYSSGMFVRLAFAMNIIYAPDILIIDEALAVGDARFQQKCMRSLNEFCNKGTVLFVSHDVSSVKKICTKVLWLEHGRIKEFGDTKEVCDKYLGEVSESVSETYIERDKDSNKEGFLNTYISTGENTLDSKIKLHLISLSSKNTYAFDDYNYIGTRQASIVDASFEKIKKGGGKIFRGDESCYLAVYIKSTKNLINAVIGFIIKDRLGQYILGINSHDCKVPLAITADQICAVVFKLHLPKIANGNYTIDLAIAEGDISNFRQLHWVYDALEITVEREGYRGVMIEPKVDHVYLVS